MSTSSPTTLNSASTSGSVNDSFVGEYSIPVGSTVANSTGGVGVGKDSGSLNSSFKVSATSILDTASLRSLIIGLNLAPSIL